MDRFKLPITLLEVGGIFFVLFAGSWLFSRRLVVIGALWLPLSVIVTEAIEKRLTATRRRGRHG